MAFEIHDIEKKRLYLESTGTLASRIDFAWEIYQNEKYKPNLRKKALDFLVYAFDLHTPYNLNQQLIELMAKRARFKSTNPDYVPGKAPESLSFDSREFVPQRIFPACYGVTILPQPIRSALASRELLDVNALSKLEDIADECLYFNAQKRGEYRVHLYKGKFYKDGKLFDSSTMRSHSKEGFAAFTLNALGELSLFEHLNGAGRIVHSSMNAGAPVVSAGELQIKKGVLTKITTHSGHYEPSLFNVYRTLEHFIQNGASLDRAKLITFKSLSESYGFKTRSIRAYAPDGKPIILHETSAKAFFNRFDLCMHKQVESIAKQVQGYQKGGFFDFIYKINNKDLYLERKELAQQFVVYLKDFNSSQQTSLPAMKYCVEGLLSAIEHFQRENSRLSQKNSKEQGSGRFAASLRMFKLEVEKCAEKNQKKMEDFSEQHVVLQSHW